MHSVFFGEIKPTDAPRQYSQADEQQFAQAGKALGENGFDLYGPGLNRNFELLDEYFQKNRNTPVTVANIYRAVEERKLEFTWLTSAQQAWYQTTQQNPELANQLAVYLAGTSGRPGALVKDGDPLFENMLVLFNELQSRRESANPQTIAHAEDRIAHRPGRQLHRVPEPRRTEPISRAAKEDDGSPFLGTGLSKQRDGSWGKSPADYAREAREAADKNNPQTTREEQLSAEDYQWRRLANEQLSYGTHGQQAEIKRTFDQAVASGASWRRVFEICNRVVNQYKGAAAVSNRSYR